jgi:hypothetical protein
MNEIEMLEEKNPVLAQTTAEARDRGITRLIAEGKDPATAKLIADDEYMASVKSTLEWLERVEKGRVYVDWSDEYYAKWRRLRAERNPPEPLSGWDIAMLLLPSLGMLIVITVFVLLLPWSAWILMSLVILCVVGVTVLVVAVSLPPAHSGTQLDQNQVGRRRSGL